MKASLFTLAAVAGLASAQFPGVPSCAIPCLTSAIAGVGCPVTDVGCQCSSTQQIQASAGACILGACTAGNDLNSAISGGLALCSAYLATASAGGSAAATTTVTSAVVTTTATSSVTQTTVTPATTSIPSPSVTAGPGTNTTTTRAPPSTTSQVPVGAGVKIAGSVGAVAGVMLAFLAL